MRPLGGYLSDPPDSFFVSVLRFGPPPVQRDRVPRSGIWCVNQAAMAFKWFVSSSSSLLIPEVQLVAGEGAEATYRVVFWPPVEGTYYVAARMEYSSREQALMDPT